jgi:site-specific DNA-methyltransferase (adenine-specific)
MDFLRSCKDKQFDLAVVDPPYGIKADENAFKNGVNCKANGFKEHKNTNWDNEIPTLEYFTELFRVSKEQIIWGGNYFTDILPPVMSWIIWDKMQYNFSFSDGEMAWYSRNTKMKIFRYARGNESGFAPKLKGAERVGINIHPTQKPVALYDWIFRNYAKPGDTILDTHMGSQSSRISAYKAGLDYTGCELDPEYFEQGNQRYEAFLKTYGTPDPTQAIKGQQINLF